MSDMGTSVGDAAGDERDTFGQPKARDLKRFVRPTLWALLTIYALAFVFSNRQDTAVNFVFRTVTLPLVFVLLGMAVVGVLLTIGFGWRRRRRSARRTER